jgi:hypothetical protein
MYSCGTEGRDAMARSKTAQRSKSPPSSSVLFIAGFGPIVRDPEVSQKLYETDLGISFEVGPGGYRHTEHLEGAKHFALWPLSQAAESCFGTEQWPTGIPAPQAWIEFDVGDVAAASRELTARGYRLLVNAREEPWGQTVTRFLGPEGLLVGVTYTPWMRKSKAKSG